MLTKAARSGRLLGQGPILFFISSYIKNEVSSFRRSVTELCNVDHLAKMYLLNTSFLQLHYFQRIDNANYTILSHTWGEEEVSFEQLQSGNYRHLAGYRKIKAACDLASKDGWGWVWIDTCCIDKKSSAELSEAINSMYHWYKMAVVCYAYLEDVSLKKQHVAGHKARNVRPSKKFQESCWFTRGWTLQELLAPRLVVFYDRD